jgi:hypothetical protein
MTSSDEGARSSPVQRHFVTYHGNEIELIAREAFEFLYEGLREAKRRFETGKNAGRDGVLHALDTLLLFLVGVGPPKNEGLLSPLVNLLNSLYALDENNVLPLLKPISPDHREPVAPIIIGEVMQFS